MPETRGHGILLDMLIEALGSPALIVNPELAKATPCRCYKVDTTEMCFTRGAIGTLSKEQIPIYCAGKEYVTEGLATRVKSFKEASEICKREIERLPRGERLEPYLKCMSRELAKRGIEI